MHLLTRHQTADLIGDLTGNGLSVRTLDRWEKLGTGPKQTQVGGRVYYTPSDIVEWASFDVTEEQIVTWLESRSSAA